VFRGQSVNVIKMIVSGGYSKVVLLRGCGDPDVIFRNWSTFFAKSAKKAITIFVSRRNLPLAKIHRFTAFFNRIAHSLKIVWRYAAGEGEEIGTRNSMWF
jgi:hypothetical protein